MSTYPIESKLQRIKEDVAMMKDQDRWPGPMLRLKTQPWHTEHRGRADFAAIHFLDPLNVIPDHGPSFRFESYEAMASQWSVD